MGKGATLALKITGDAAGGVAALKETEDAGNGIGSVFGKVGAVVAAGAAVGVAALVGFGKASFDAASDLEQSSGAITSIFGESADAMYGWGHNAAESAGLAESKYYELANVLGSQLKNMGYAGEGLANQTNDLVKLGADLAAQFGGSTADAVEALSSVFKGETDPIERYGVSIKQSDISARLAAQGQDKLTGAALKQATAQAALGLVMEQTKSAQGQFAAQGNTAAEVSQKLGAQWENLKATAGGYLLPVFSSLASFMGGPLKSAIDYLADGSGPLFTAWGEGASFLTTGLIPALSSLWDRLGPKLLPIFHDVAGFITGFVVPAFAMVADYLFRFVIPALGNYLSPILSAVGRVFHEVTGKIMEHKDTFIGLYDSLKPFLAFIRDNVAPFVGGAFAVGFTIAGKAISAVVDIVAFLIDKIKWILDKGAAVGKFIGGLFGAPAGGGGGGGGGKRGAVLGATRGGLFGAAGSLGGGGAGPSATAAGLGTVPVGDTYVITINGALDPTAVADQLARMLDQRARRLGQRPAFGGVA